MLQFWLIAGLVMVALEIIVPGGILAPLGLGALLVALLIWIGTVDHWIPALTVWFICSLILILVVRFAFQRLMPGDEEWSSPDEDADAFDKEVEISETIEKGRTGRILFRGSSWPATCYDRTLNPGDRAKIFYRDGLKWVVTPISEESAPAASTETRENAGS